MSNKIQALDPQNVTANLPIDGPLVRVPLTPMDMLARAVASGADIEVLEKLMGLQERWQANQARMDFDAAMAAAKAEIPIIFKNRKVDFTSAKGRTNYKYEDLAEIARVLTPILGKHGLSYRYRTTSKIDEPVTVTCIVSHKSGHFEENTLSAGRDDSGNKNSIQAISSTCTYLQRVTLKAALGLAASEDDDDGRGGGSGMGGPISEEQLVRLQELALGVHANLDELCSLLKVDVLSDLPARQFDSAMALLKMKRAAMKKPTKEDAQ